VFNGAMKRTSRESTYEQKHVDRLVVRVLDLLKLKFKVERVEQFVGGRAFGRTGRVRLRSVVAIVSDIVAPVRIDHEQIETVTGAQTLKVRKSVFVEMLAFGGEI
jgi:hypothetical protein